MGAPANPRNSIFSRVIMGRGRRRIPGAGLKPLISGARRVKRHFLGNKLKLTEDTLTIISFERAEAKKKNTFGFATLKGRRVCAASPDANPTDNTIGKKIFASIAWL